MCDVSPSMCIRGILGDESLIGESLPMCTIRVLSKSNFFSSRNCACHNGF